MYLGVHMVGATRMKSLVTGILLMGSTSLMAGGGNETTGARAAGLGGCNVVLTDGWATTNNVAALGLLNYSFAGVAYENRFLLPQTGLKALSIASPLSGGSIGLIGHSFGFAGYSENRVGLAYGRKLSDVLSLGVQLNMVHLRMGDIYGFRTTATAGIGLLITPNDDFKLGVSLYNPTRTALADFDDERLPTRLSIGAGYVISDKVRLLGQVDKDLILPINARFGVEYEPLDQLFLRAGASSLNRSFSIGLGYFWQNVNIDVSQHWDQRVGFGATASLSYRIPRKKSSA